MCGLMYVKKLDGLSAVRIAVKRYNSQSQRGKNGFGYVTIDDGYISDVKRFTEEVDFLASLNKEESSEILIHHRAPTSTENYLGTTHPVVVSDDFFEYNYYLIHNGTLTNESALKAEHEKLGLEYVTEYKKTISVNFKNHSEERETSMTGFLDSEALAKEFALFAEGHKTTIDTRGGVAFICIQTEKDGKVKTIYYGCNTGRPLIVESVISKKKKKRTGAYVVLKSQGGGKQISENVVYKFDYATGVESHVDVNIGTPYYTNTYTQTMGYNTYKKKEVPLLPENTKKAEKIDFDLVVHDGPISAEDIKTCNTIILEERLEEIEEKLINLDADQKVWQETVFNTDDQSEAITAQYEIDAIIDERKELSLEKFTIEKELMNRIADEEIGIVTPYQQYLNEQQGRIIEM